jgi:DNA polymerase III epsilon subunit-like protein
VRSPVWEKPDGLRLVVVDVETVVGPEGKHRIVSLGAAVCRHGTVGHRVSWPINPSCPVDEVTANIHGLTDDFLAQQPTIDEIMPDFLRLLRPREAETVVLCAHNVRFDVPSLRDEIARTGAPALPDLPLLDTAATLRALAGLSLRSRKLAELLRSLDVTNLKEHDALADATATAEAAVRMINLAGERGFTTVAGLLAETDDGRTGTVKEDRPPRSRREGEEVPVWLPPDHVRTHHAAFPTAPAREEWTAWRGAIAECAALRCGDIASRPAIVPEAALRRLLFSVLPDADGPGAATLLLALAPLLTGLPSSLPEARKEAPALPSVPGAVRRRAVGIALARWLSQILPAKGRCSPADPCPACREGEACPLDIWPQAVAAVALNETEAAVDAFWSPGDPPSEQGFGVLRPKSAVLADAMLRRCVVFWRERGRLGTARTVAHQAFQAGCRDPEVAAYHAELVAAGGRLADLTAAIADCEAVLALRGGSTDPTWNALAARAAWFNARVTALLVPAERRHHPSSPRRPARLPRFLRAGVRHAWTEGDDRPPAAREAVGGSGSKIEPSALTQQSSGRDGQERGMGDGTGASRGWRHG